MNTAMEMGEQQGPVLAIQDAEVGTKIKRCRVLRPDEVKALEVIDQVKKQLTLIDAYDEEMKAKLESALDDPSVLRDLTGRYLGEAERLRLGVWGTDDVAFRRLDEAELILRFVIDTYREDLLGHAITTVFQEKVPPANRRGRMGTAMKLPGKLRFLSDFDAVITLGFNVWASLSDRDRQRLIHHELEHYESVDGGLAVRGHDFEDFYSIVDVYGPCSESGIFTTDGRFVDVLRIDDAQLEILNPTVKPLRAL